MIQERSKMATSGDAESFHRLVADELSCPICFEEFEDPKSLPSCAHNVCKACLHQLVTRSASKPIECPMCRMKSPVSPTGVDGFPTNTLLVRLLDNTPGRKEKQAIRSALESYKLNLKATETKLQTIRNCRAEVETSSMKRNLLRNEISRHADELVGKIREQEKKLCSEVKNYSDGIQSWEAILNASEKNLMGVMEQGSQCVENVEQTLQQNDKEEMINMKGFIVDQLQEFTLAMNVGDIDVNAMRFEMKFQKGDLKTGEELVGKVSAPNRAEVAFSGSCEAASEKDRNTCGANAAADDCCQLPEVNCERDVHQRITFNFAPTSFAVSQNTGEIAVLCGVSRQVHHYSPQGAFLHTIFIKYGNLKDVAFSGDECIIVVNHANNRILYYAKDGIFQKRFMKVYISDVRIHCVSVDCNGRLILTSTPSDDNSGEGRPCVLVFNNDREFSFMFGENNLEHPYGKAIYHNSTFFVADNGGQVIKLFAENGRILRNLNTSNCCSDAQFRLLINPINAAIFLTDVNDKSVKVMNWEGQIVGDTIEHLSDKPRVIQLYHEPRCTCRTHIKVFIGYYGTKYIDMRSYQFPGT